MSRRSDQLDVSQVGTAAWFLVEIARNLHSVRYFRSTVLEEFMVAGVGSGQLLCEHWPSLGSYLSF